MIKEGFTRMLINGIAPIVGFEKIVSLDRLQEGAFAYVASTPLSEYQNGVPIGFLTGSPLPIIGVGDMYIDPQENMFSLPILHETKNSVVVRRIQHYARQGGIDQALLVDGQKLYRYKVTDSGRELSPSRVFADDDIHPLERTVYHAIIAQLKNYATNFNTRSGNV